MFKKYNSIQNSYRENLIKNIKDVINPDFIVTEKIHGSNLSFMYNKEYTKPKVRIYSRNLKINGNGNHPVYSGVYNKYEEDIIKLYDRIKEWYENMTHIQVFGEFFGGNYPHPDVEKNNESKKIQKGVLYTPDNDFLVFDVYLHFSENDGFYLEYSKVIYLFEELNLNLKLVPELFRGKFNECLNYPNDGESVVYKLYNLPKIEMNIMEGVVIKPLNINLDLYNIGRVIIKNKNEQFKEKSHERKRIKSNKKDNLKEEYIVLLGSISQYITENRLRNVLSHGDIKVTSKNQFGDLNKLFIKDVIDSFNNENEDILKKIENTDGDSYKIILKSINQSTSKVVGKNIIDIIDEYF